MDQSEDTEPLLSVCLLAAAVFPLYTDSAFPILTIRGDMEEWEEEEVAVPCHPDITVTTIISLMKRQHKQYSLSYRKDNQDIQIEGDVKGLELFDLQQTEGVVISLRKRVELQAL